MDFLMKEAMYDQKCGIRWKRGICLMDLDFADNIALLANTRANLQSMTTNLEREAGKIGLRLNSEKMKVMIIGETTVFPQVTISHQTTEEFQCFTHFSRVVDNNGKVEVNVNSRIGKASSMFQRLCLICSMSTISLRTKFHLHNTLITLIATFTSETWKMTSRSAKSSMYSGRAICVGYWVSDTGIRSQMKKYCKEASKASLNSQ